MDFLKKHYEKVVLGVVLVGLAVAVGFLPFLISGEREKREQRRIELQPANVKPLTNLDLTLSESVLKRVATPAVIDFSAPNKIFNPMPWQKSADDQLVPLTSVGLAAVTVSNVVPLYLRLSLDSVTASDTGARYVVGVQKEAAATPNLRGKKQTYVSLNSKNDTFALVEVKGKPEEPTQLILELNDTGERVAVSREQPYQRADGYMADFRYDPEKKVWLSRRVGASLMFGGEEYIIVAINPNEVVLSAKSNQKKWPIKLNPNPNAAS